MLTPATPPPQERLLEVSMPGFESHEKILQVLRMLVDAGGGIDDRAAAQTMWPGSRLWLVEARVAGPGGFREKGVKLHSVAAALMGRIARRGLARRPRKGFTEITSAGREYIGRAMPKPAFPPPQPTSPAFAPHPAYAPPGTRVFVVDHLGVRYAATVANYSGFWVLVRYDNGLHAWIDPRSAFVA